MTRITYARIDEWDSRFSRRYTRIHLMSLDELMAFRNELREAIVGVRRKIAGLEKRKRRYLLKKGKIPKSSVIDERITTLRKIYRKFEQYEDEVILFIREIEDEQKDMPLWESLLLPISKIGEKIFPQYPVVSTYDSFDFLQVIDHSWYPMMHGGRNDR